MLEDREAKDVFEQLGRQVGQLFGPGLGNNPVQARSPLSGYTRRHFYCLPRLPHRSGAAPLWRRGQGWGGGAREARCRAIGRLGQKENGGAGLCYLQAPPKLRDLFILRVDWEIKIQDKKDKKDNDKVEYKVNSSAVKRKSSF